jgi:hypothetical protein
MDILFLTVLALWFTLYLLHACASILLSTTRSAGKGGMSPQMTHMIKQGCKHLLACCVTVTVTVTLVCYHAAQHFP